MANTTSTRSFDDQVRRGIPAEFHMISASHDAQTSVDVSLRKFQLPDGSSAGRIGGACTSAFLKVMYRDGMKTWVELLRAMRRVLMDDLGYTQTPELTSSRMIDVNAPMYIVPPDSTGQRIAILIAINYTGQSGDVPELQGCHNDLHNIKKYLIDKQGFKEADMLILMDDGEHFEPTKRNIEAALQRVTELCKKGDAVFVLYSGHGGQVVDTSGDEPDGLDETILPVDARKAGPIIDDQILETFVKPMQAGVTVTVLMDCCHSGSMLDLPYRFEADDSQMRVDEGFDTNSLRKKTDATSLKCCLFELIGCILDVLR